MIGHGEHTRIKHVRPHDDVRVATRHEIAQALAAVEPA